MNFLKQVKVITSLLIIWQKYDSPFTSRSETHVLLSIKNEASHWLAIWTVCSTLTHCERRRETLISSVIQNNQIIHNFTISLLSASMFVSQLLILHILTAVDSAQVLLIQNSTFSLPLCSCIGLSVQHHTLYLVLKKAWKAVQCGSFTCSVGLVNHGLDYPPPCIDKPGGGGTQGLFKEDGKVTAKHVCLCLSLCMCVSISGQPVESQTGFGSI